MKKIALIKNISLPLILLGLVLIAIKCGMLSLSSLVGEGSESIHFNLITVNAVFAGFLFTSITFFIGVNNSKTVEILEQIDYMDKVYKNLNFGFIASLISIIFSLISIFILPAITASKNFLDSPIKVYILNTIMPAIVLVSMIYTIIKFLNALRHLQFIITSIRRKSKINAPSKERIEKTLQKIK
ncbi:hypothetical protein H8S10_11475 [Clostridium sp. NSJ-49]|uniref:hypothetical protein n=1 Tax=Clostridium TaxID=1485 RepID=UPI00164B19DF|nr:hypothetical protein [Clostridium sp. NSJ-49]MBC5626075.1 hypothetical protein [Clostridium sp. NSJ-49]